jgi:hypothetical protein
MVVGAITVLRDTLSWRASWRVDGNRPPGPNRPLAIAIRRLMESCSHNGVVLAGSRKTGRAFSLAARFMAAFKMALVLVAFRATGYR